MSHTPDTDVLIIGAGLAGLSIASWLADTGGTNPLPRVTLVEPTLEDSNAHTWCFWDQQPHPFTDAIEHRWPRWRLQSGTRVIEREDPHACYAMLSEEALRRSAYQKLEGLSAFALMRGVHVSSIIPGRESLSVDTSNGTLTTRLVIDTRPPARSTLRQQQGLWQVFHGVEVHAPKHGYDLSAVTLMDFQPSAESINFIYLLPLSSDRLLVEWTCFHADRDAPVCSELLASEGLPDQLATWLDQHVPQWTVERHEAGCLPMMPVQPPVLDNRYLAAGTRGGWMRPATGYSFETCQRAAQNIAQQLIKAASTRQWQLTAPNVRPTLLNWMDSVFLHALRRQPADAPEWFMRMFERTQASQQRRFLGDAPRMMDMLAMIRALPPGPFIKSAMAVAFSYKDPTTGASAP